MLPVRCFRSLISAVLALMVITGWSGNAEACRLRVAWNDFPPYQFLNSAGVLDGIDTRLMNEAASRMGCTVIWQDLPRQRSLVLIREGVVDVRLGASWTVERATYAHYSRPIRNGINAFFVRKGEVGKLPYTSLLALAEAKVKIGAQLGTRYSSEFEQLFREGKFGDSIAYAASTENAFQMLLHNRVEGIFDGQLTGRWELMRLGVESQVEEHRGLQIEGVAYAIFSRRSVDPELVDRFDQAIAAMRSDGTHARIMQEGEQLRPDVNLVDRR
jgi:polar amino acid transport system substrate-binding protein